MSIEASQESNVAPAPPPPKDPRDSLEALLGRAMHAAGAEVDVEALVRVAERAFRRYESSDDPLDLLDGALGQLGLHTQPLSGTISQLLRSVGPEHPAVALSPSGEWFLITPARGRGATVERASATSPHGVGRAELASLLSAGPDDDLQWLAVDPPGLLDPGHGVGGSPGHRDAPSPWMRLRGLVIRERQDVLVAFIYAAGAGLLALATPIAVQSLVNTVAFGTLMQPVVVLSILLLGGLAFAGVLRGLQAWVVEILQRRIFLRLVDDLAHRLPRVAPSAFDQAHGPELLNRFFDIFTIQKAASSLLIDGLQVFLTAFVGMLVLAFYHPLLLAFDVVLMLLVIGILFGLGRGATRTAVYESKAKYEVASWLQEIARHPTVFKLAGGPRLAQERADSLAASYLTRRKLHFRVVFRQLAGALTLQAFASAGILGIGGYLVIDRQLTLGQLVAAELIVTLVVAAFSKIGKHLETTYDLLAALDKVGTLIDLPLEADGIAVSPEATEGGAWLRVEDLAHGFDGRGRLFESLSFEITPGDRVALTGRSGAGLSTLAEILLGVRRNDRGRVAIDGVDLADLDRDAIRAETALVRDRDIVLGSIFDNVAFGRRDVDATDVRAALRAVGLLDEISRLEDGIATRLMPDGAPLSEGQAARLSLARALAGSPRLVVVDGALDGLDFEARELALSALTAPDAPWTLIVITHRSDIARRMDRTLTLSLGQITAAATNHETED